MAMISKNTGEVTFQIDDSSSKSVYILLIKATAYIEVLVYSPYTIKRVRTLY